MLVLAHKSAFVPPGADGIEFDVMKTADGDLVVSHDERAPGDGAPIHRLTMDELRRRGFVSLRDVFAAAAAHGGQPFLNIEIKGGDCWEETWRQARTFCAQTGYPYDRVVFSSFDHAQLLKLRQADPDAKIGLIFGATLGRWTLPLRLHPATGGHERRKPLTTAYLDSVIEAIKPTSLHPASFNFARAAAYARRHGLDLFVWAGGEKDPRTDARLGDVVRAAGGDAHVHVISNFPAQMRALRPGTP